MKKGFMNAVKIAALICLVACFCLAAMGFTRPGRVVFSEQDTEDAPSVGVDSGDDSAITTGASEDGSDPAVPPENDEPAETTGEDDSVDKNSIVLSVIGAAIAAVFVAIILISNFKKDKNGERRRVTTQQLTESALMIAVATVCSMVKFDLPFGGGVTVVSMLPLILISHRYGWRWGVTTAFVYSLIQLALGLDNVGYATSTFMAFGVIFLDYIVAYTVIGLSGVFGRSRKAVAAGISVTFFLRFICHYATGVWIWKEWMPETYMGLAMKSPWIYSALYNGWYMLAEFVLTMIVAMLIYKPLEKYFTGAEN